jgi:two-component system CitB family sensor kinase
LVALLLGKAASAAERGLELRLGSGSRLPDDYAHVRDLVTIVGYRVDNALDAAASNGAGGWVEVSFEADERDGLYIRVHDSGPGVDRALVDEIFKDGFTTKVKSGTSRRGLGLALVSQTVRRHGGRISVENRKGALFTVYLPLPAKLPDSLEPALA